ncbi:unnamed protein product [Urochloa humidicola]
MAALLGARGRGTRWPPPPRWFAMLVRWLRHLGAAAAELARCRTPPLAAVDDPPRNTPPFPPPRPAAADEEPPKFSCRANGVTHPSASPARGGRYGGSPEPLPRPPPGRIPSASPWSKAP